jgi:hypothetical protein
MQNSHSIYQSLFTKLYAFTLEELSFLPAMIPFVVAQKQEQNARLVRQFTETAIGMAANSVSEQTEESIETNESVEEYVCEDPTPAEAAKIAQKKVPVQVCQKETVVAKTAKSLLSGPSSCLVNGKQAVRGFCGDEYCPCLYEAADSRDPCLSDVNLIDENTLFIHNLPKHWDFSALREHLYMKIEHVVSRPDRTWVGEVEGGGNTGIAHMTFAKHELAVAAAIALQKCNLHNKPVLVNFCRKRQPKQHQQRRVPFNETY